MSPRYRMHAASCFLSINSCVCCCRRCLLHPSCSLLLLLLQVFVSPLFLVGEVPSGMGLCGVAVVSLAGYKLGVLGAADAAALNQQGGKPAKIKAPLLPVGANGVGAAAGSKLMAHQHDEHEVQHLIPAADVRSRMGELSHTGQQLQQQHSRVYQRQPAQLLSTGTAAASAAGAGAVASSPGLHTTNSSRIGTQQAVLQQRQQSPEHAQGNHLQEGQLLHHPQAQDGSIAGGADARGGSSGGSNKTKSAWAIAYYKQKSPPVGVWEAACGGLQSAAKQLLSTTGANSPRGRGPAGGAAQGLFAAGSPNGHHHHHHHSGNGLLSSTDSSGGTAGNSNGSSNNSWEEDSQAKAGKDLKLEVLSKRGGALPAGQRGGSSSSSGWVVRRWLPWLHAPLQRLRRSMHGTAQLLSGPSAGPTLVLIVAFLYSLTASVDKLGMSASSSTAFYLCVQRVLIGAASLLYLLVSSPRTLRHLYKDAVLLVTLSLVEQASIVLYFKAIQNILVSAMACVCFWGDTPHNTRDGVGLGFRAGERVGGLCSSWWC